MRGMDKFSFFILFGLSTPFVNAQNLVPNSSFEEVSTCNVSSLYDAMENSIVDWETYDYSTNSPDIFNECFSLATIQLPNNSFGHSFAQDGKGMAGFGLIPSTDYRESISTSLIAPLQKDSAYCISFFVKNSNAGNQNYYSKNLGLVFTEGSTNYEEIRTMEPTIFYEDEIDGDDWVEISNYYIAKGNESYLHFGYWGGTLDFYHASGSDGCIYYYVDNVSVRLCNKDSLLAVILDLPNIFTPNGDFVNDSYTINQHNLKTLDIQIMNRWGNLILRYDGLTYEWDGTDRHGISLPEGVYFINATAETIFGEVFSKSGFIHLLK